MEEVVCHLCQKSVPFNFQVVKDAKTGEYQKVCAVCFQYIRSKKRKFKEYIPYWNR